MTKRKYCLDCEFHQIIEEVGPLIQPANRIFLMWKIDYCNHPEMLNEVTKESIKCEYLRQKNGLCGRSAEHYQERKHDENISQS